jgi:hypothetical protein
MRSLSLPLLASLAACTSLQPAAADAPAAPAAAACEPATLDQFKGQAATAELGARMLRATGKTALRWVQPGMMVTMDYREDRLTVHLDAANRVERASCT